MCCYDENMEDQQLTKKERRQMKREEKAHEIESGRRARHNKAVLFWGVSIVAVFAVGFGIFKLLSAPAQDLEASILKTCVTHSGGMHIHPDLRIVINGEAQEISANVGISGNCMRPLHTHDGTGKLHVEFPRPHDFTLGDFFSIWEKSFSAQEILGYKADDSHTIEFSVNGAPSNEYQKYVVKDHDELEIRYVEQKGAQ